MTESSPSYKRVRTHAAIAGRDERHRGASGWRGFDFIDDLTVRMDVPTTADVRNAVDFLNSRQLAIAPGRWAVVVHPRMPATFGMLRMANR